MVEDERYIVHELSKHLPKNTPVSLQRRNIPTHIVNRAERVVGKKFPIKPKYYTYAPEKRIAQRRRTEGWDAFSQDVYEGKKKKPVRILVTIPESSHKDRIVREATLTHELAEVLCSSHGSSYSRCHSMGLKAENIAIRKHGTSRRKITSKSKKMFNKMYGKKRR